MNIFGRRDASASPIQTTPTYFRFDTCARDRRRRRRRGRPRPSTLSSLLPPLSLSLSSLHVAQRVPQDPVTPLARERFWRGEREEEEGGGGAVIQPDKRS